MKSMFGIALVLMAGSAIADDLADANRLLLEKSYGAALPLYQRLAEAGNPEAQMRLGEMYWFGDGTVADLGKAKAWFEKSAAAGNADAQASLASLERRKTHGKEIDYWTRAYDGADMVSGKFACTAPTLPALSGTKDQILAASARIDAFSACYNGFVDNLAAALPAGKRIPAEVVDMMTPAEAAQAQRHLDKVYARLAFERKRSAEDFARQAEVWRSATEQYVKTEAYRNVPIYDSLDHSRYLVGGMYPSNHDPMNTPTTISSTSIR